MQKLPLLLLLFPVFIAAQPKVSRTEAFKSSDDIWVSGFWREPGTGNILMLYYTLDKVVTFNTKEGFKSRWVIDRFGSDLKQIKAGKMQKPKFPDGEEVGNGCLVILDGKPNLLCYHFEEKAQKTSIYRFAIDAGDNFGKPELLGALENKSEYFLYPRLYYSPDSSYVLLSQKTNIDDKFEATGYMLLDRNLKVVRQGKLPIPGSPQDFVYLFGEPLVDTDGSIWMPVWTKEKKKKKDKRKDSEFMVSQEVWVWRRADAQPRRINLQLSDEKLITGVSLRQSGNLIYAAGLYAANTEYARYAIYWRQGTEDDSHPEQGSFLLKLDAASGSINSRFESPFRESTLQYWDKKAKDIAKNGGIDHLIPNSVSILPDGSAWLTCEEYYYQTAGGSTIVGASSVITPEGFPRTGPILAILYNASGEVIRELTVGRRSTAVGHTGFFFEANENGLLFLYNDNEDNLNPKIDKAKDLKSSRIPNSRVGIPRPQHDACAVMCHVDKNGKKSMKNLFTFREADYWLDPIRYIKIEAGAFIFACEGRNGRYGLLRMDW